jgi:hypothetical protein
MLEKTVTTELIQQLKNQGLSFMLIAIMTYYFYKELDLMKTMLYDCQKERNELLLEFLRNDQ